METFLVVKNKIIKLLGGYTQSEYDIHSEFVNDCLNDMHKRKNVTIIIAHTLAGRLNIEGTVFFTGRELLFDKGKMKIMYSPSLNK